MTVWFTGLPSSGKTTIGKEVLHQLQSAGYKAELLDGDVIRKGLSRDLGYSPADREENIKRIAFVAEILARNDVIVLVAAISPYRATREEVRQRCSPFLEVFVNAPLKVCQQRDVKGLYGKAKRGEIQGMTGVDDVYEAPVAPDIECRTDVETVEQSARKVLECLAQHLQTGQQFSLSHRTAI